MRLNSINKLEVGDRVGFEKRGVYATQYGVIRKTSKRKTGMWAYVHCFFSDPDTEYFQWVKMDRLAQCLLPKIFHAGGGIYVG